MHPARKRLRRSVLLAALAVFCVGLFWFTWARMFFVGILLGLIPKLWTDTDAMLDLAIRRDRATKVPRHSGAHPRPDAPNKA